MTALQTYLAALRPGMDIVAECAGLPAEAIQEMGAPDATARTLAGLAEAFFGRTKFSRMQARAVEAARQRHHALPTLEVIERYARKAPTKAAAWELRLELCRTAADTAAMEKLARRKLRQLRTPRTPREGIRILRRPAGVWSLIVTATSEYVANLWSLVNAERPLESFEEAVFSGESRPRLRTHIVVPLKDWAALADAPSTAEEITLTLSNGATITGAQYLAKVFDGTVDTEATLATIIHPLKGPINAYRLDRLGSWKHRVMAIAEHQTCAWRGCHRPADGCQLHHIVSWAHGGDTNPENLVLMCPYHNAVNQDDPGSPPLRGRVDRINGVVQWHV